MWQQKKFLDKQLRKKTVEMFCMKRGIDTWMLKEEERKLKKFEMWVWRRMGGIT